MSDRATSCAVCGQAVAVEAAGTGGSRGIAPVYARPPVPEAGPHPCSECGSLLDLGATFCSECGSAVTTGEYVSPPTLADPGPERDVVVPAFDPVVTDVESVADELDDAVVVPEVDTPKRRNHVRLAESEEEEPTLPISDSRAVKSGDDLWSWVPPAAAAFALFALLTAMLVHVVAPSTLANYSAAELSLKTQMRAVEWLLAGALMALVGLLAKR